MIVNKKKAKTAAFKRLKWDAAQKEIVVLRLVLEATRADWEAAVQENLALRKRLGLGHTQD